MSAYAGAGIRPKFESRTAKYDFLGYGAGLHVRRAPLSAGIWPVRPMTALPVHLTSFIGRRTTIELVVDRLSAHRLVSLVGPGGCGKTRLAIEVARQPGSRGPGRACFVDLSGLSNPALVPDAVRSTLGLA